MPFADFWNSIKVSVAEAMKVLNHTLAVLKKHPEITTYPYAAAIFTSITYPLVSTTIFADWYRRIFSETSTLVPHNAGIIIGLVGFLAFYTALIAAYFTSAASISVIAKMEGLQVPPFYGLMRVIRHFFRVTRFAIFSVFFFPVGIIIQWRKLPSGWAGVLGSSLTLHMAQAAPAVLTTKKSFSDTLHDSIDTLGRAWRVSLVLKIGMYLIVFLLVVLPKLIQTGFFNGPTADKIGWIISIELGASSLVAFKVLNSIFTAVLYHEARHKNSKK